MKNQWDYAGHTIVLNSSNDASIYQGGIKVEKLFMIGGTKRQFLKWACKIINERRPQ